MRHNSMRLHRTFITACFIFSFLFSLLLLWGPIEDFFSYYYVGRAIVWGRDMYADVAHNKGPVTYLFFALLYGIFGARYDLAIVAASTVLDGLFCTLLFSVLYRWTGYTVPAKKSQQLILAFLCIGYIKSFSIGTMRGAVHPEQLAMTFLFLSFWLFEKNYLWRAGAVFAFAFLSRQSVAAFILVFLVRTLTKRTSPKAIMAFAGGVFCVMAVFVLFFWWKGTTLYVWENLVVSVLQHRRGDAGQIAYTLLIQIRAFLSLLFAGIFFLRYWRNLYRSNEIPLCISLVASCLLSVSGAMVWGRQFLQWTPLFLFCFLWIRAKRIVDYTLVMVHLVVLSSVIVSYLVYIQLGYSIDHRIDTKWPEIPEIAQKSYLLTVFPYEKLYIDYEKEAPDRYFLPFFWLNPWYYGDWTRLAISRHAMLSKDRLRETAFVFIYPFDRGPWSEQWYLDEFGEAFRLTHQATYTLEDMRMEVFYSRV